LSTRGKGTIKRWINFYVSTRKRLSALQFAVECQHRLFTKRGRPAMFALCRFITNVFDAPSAAAGPVR